MKCSVCGGESGEKVYCKPHMKAYENVIKGHERWSRAMEISWKEYLSEIAKNPSTGEWAREIAEYLITSGEKLDVKSG